MNENIIKELLKLYPKVKIPNENNYQFYIETLLKDKSYEWLSETILSLNDLFSQLKEKGNNQTITDYKFECFDKLKDFFNVKIENYKDKTFTQNLLDYRFDFNYTKKSFNTWNEQNLYISIDLSEANWNTYKKYSGINGFFDRSFDGKYKQDNWSTFLQGAFDIHPAIANSKSFRQLVLGNTNPKRLSHLQEYEMSLIFNQLQNTFDENKVVSKNSDELIIEFEKELDENSVLVSIDQNNLKELDDILYVIKHLKTELPLKYTIFTIKTHNNFGELVKVKNILNNKLETERRELFGVSGSRFFIHFRTLILKEEINAWDTIFVNDGFFANWILPSNVSSPTRIICTTDSIVD